MNNDKYKLVKRINNIKNGRIEADIKEQQKFKYRSNLKIINLGINHALKGLSLGDITEDATEEIQKDYNFIVGFEKGIRLLNVNDDFYLKGAEAFIFKRDLDTIPDDDK